LSTILSFQFLKHREISNNSVNFRLSVWTLLREMNMSALLLPLVIRFRLQLNFLNKIFAIKQIKYTFKCHIIVKELVYVIIRMKLQEFLRPLPPQASLILTVTDCKTFMYVHCSGDRTSALHCRDRRVL